MDIRVLIIELWEKIGLIATAALVSVLLPPLRNRLLGVGRARDRWFAFGLGVLLAMWAPRWGSRGTGHYVHLAAIGIMTAAILGGLRVGLLAGIVAAAHFGFRIYQPAALAAALAFCLDGALTGWIAEHRPRLLHGLNAVPTIAAIQVLTLSLFCVVLPVNVTNRGLR